MMEQRPCDSDGDFRRSGAKFFFSDWAVKEYLPDMGEKA
jgi:hypothetical protein